MIPLWLSEMLLRLAVSGCIELCYRQSTLPGGYVSVRQTLGGDTQSSTVISAGEKRGVTEPGGAML